MNGLRNELAIFALAVQFLTRAPVPLREAYSPERMAASVRYYPLVGALVGAAAAAAFAVANLALPLAVSVIIALAAALLLTGAFHEDGLADTFDGVGGGATREAALAIMRDSRIGVYGTLALVVAIALKIAALGSLAPMVVCGALIVAHGLSRLASVVVIATAEYARDAGTAKPVAMGVSAQGMAFAVAASCVVVATGAAFLPTAAIACGLCGLVVGALFMRAFFEAKLGGYTGDALGAVQQASEIGFYLGVAAWA